MNPLFQEILDAHIKPVSRYAEPLCYFCDHVVDLADSFDRIPTLESVTKGKPEAFAHELCAAEADAEYMEDKALDTARDYALEVPDHDFYDAFGEEL